LKPAVCLEPFGLEAIDLLRQELRSHCMATISHQERYLRFAEPAAGLAAHHVAPHKRLGLAQIGWRVGPPLSKNAQWPG
jgi:hypothetical protein